MTKDGIFQHKNRQTNYYFSLIQCSPRRSTSSRDKFVDKKEGIRWSEFNKVWSSAFYDRNDNEFVSVKLGHYTKTSKDSGIFINGIQLEGKKWGDMDVKREEKHGRGLERTKGWTEGAVFKTKINSRSTFCGYEEFMGCKINRNEFLCCANYVAGFCVRLINEANKSSHFCRRFILIYRCTNLRDILCAKNSLDNAIFMKSNEEIIHEILVIFLSWQKWHSLQEPCKRKSWHEEHCNDNVERTTAYQPGEQEFDSQSDKIK